MLSTSVALTLKAVRLRTVLFLLRFVVFTLMYAIVGFPFRTDSLAIEIDPSAKIPSLVPSLGVAMTVQFSYLAVSCATMTLVLFCQRAKICSAERERLKIVTSSMVPLNRATVESSVFQDWDPILVLTFAAIQLSSLMLANEQAVMPSCVPL